MLTRRHITIAGGRGYRIHVVGKTYAAGELVQSAHVYVLWHSTSALEELARRRCAYCCARAEGYVRLGMEMWAKQERDGGVVVKAEKGSVGTCAESGLTLAEHHDARVPRELCAAGRGGHQPQPAVAPHVTQGRLAAQPRQLTHL